MIAIATRVVSDYGRVLASIQPGLYGLPESLLPHQRARIHRALVTLLKRTEPEPELEAIREGLVRGLVYLAQFVPDDEVAIIRRGQSLLAAGAGADDPDSTAALRIINRIKLDMERAMDEARALLAAQPPR